MNTQQITGNDMDVPVKKRWVKRYKWWLITGSFVIAGSLAGVALLSAGPRKFRADRNKVMTGKVERGDFSEFVVFTGNVMPARTVFLNALEGGQVQEIFAESGQQVKKGDPILKLQNSTLRMNYVNRQAEILGQINIMRNTKIQVQTTTLNLRQELLETAYQLSLSEKKYHRGNQLFAGNVIAAAEFEPISDEYIFLGKKKKLLEEKLRQDSILSTYQLKNIDPSLALMQKSLEFINESLENLTLRAPVDGQLSSLDVEIGQSVASGQHIARIDIWDGYKIRAGVEEYYLQRVQEGHTGFYESGSIRYPVQVVKVFPEVANGRFNVDLVFTGDAPQGIRRGQTLEIRLELGIPSVAVYIPAGGYMSATGGRWVYVVDAGGKYAVKRNIVPGRQNASYIEVLEGLAEGEEIIISGYETFGNADKIIFN